MLLNNIKTSSKPLGLLKSLKLKSLELPKLNVVPLIAFTTLAVLIAAFALCSNLKIENTNAAFGVQLGEVTTLSAPSTVILENCNPSTSNGSDAFDLYADASGNVSPRNSLSRGYGFSVRCLIPGS